MKYLKQRWTLSSKIQLPKEKNCLLWERHLLKRLSAHSKDSVTPPDNIHTPLEYFRKFITEEMIELLKEKTNLYRVQKSAHHSNVNTNVKELEILICIYLHIGRAYSWWLTTCNATVFRPCWHFYTSLITLLCPMPTSLGMCETLPSNQNYKVFADNLFSSAPLVLEPLQRQIYFNTPQQSLGWLSAWRWEKFCEERQRICGCQGGERWIHGHCQVVWQWMISSYCAVEPKDKTWRWSKSDKAFMEVNRPHIEKEYNTFIEGV